MPQYCCNRSVLPYLYPLTTARTVPNPRRRACGGHCKHGGGAQVHTRVRQGGASSWGTPCLHVRVQAVGAPEVLHSASPPKPRHWVRSLPGSAHGRAARRQGGAHPPWAVAHRTPLPGRLMPAHDLDPPPSPSVRYFRRPRPCSNAQTLLSLCRSVVAPLRVTPLAIHYLVAGVRRERVRVVVVHITSFCTRTCPPQNSAPPPLARLATSRMWWWTLPTGGRSWGTGGWGAQAGTGPRGQKLRVWVRAPSARAHPRMGTKGPRPRGSAGWGTAPQQGDGLRVGCGHRLTHAGHAAPGARCW